MVLKFVFEMPSVMCNASGLFASIMIDVFEVYLLATSTISCCIGND